MVRQLVVVDKPWPIAAFQETDCQMEGMNPAFVAAQLGHSITMLLTTYAKWIHGEASQRKLGQNRDKMKSVESN